MGLSELFHRKKKGPCNKVVESGLKKHNMYPKSTKEFHIAEGKLQSLIHCLY